MDGFLLALLLVFALAMGGRDQLMVARRASALGASAQLLATAVLCAAISAGAMAWIGAEFAVLLPRRAGQMLVAFALAVAAAELALPVRTSPPRGPMRSLGAFGAVLLVRQLSDGARFAVFALSAWSIWPAMTGIGGAMGGAAAAALGWGAGAARLGRLPLRALRIGLAVCLAIAALFVGLGARYASA